MSERKRKIISITVLTVGALLWLGTLFLIFIRSTFNNAWAVLRTSHAEGALYVVQEIANAIEGKSVAMSIPHDLINGVLDVSLYLLLGLLSLVVSRRFVASKAVIAAPTPRNKIHKQYYKAVEPCLKYLRLLLGRKNSLCLCRSFFRPIGS